MDSAASGSAEAFARPVERLYRLAEAVEPDDAAAALSHLAARNPARA